MKCFLFVVLLSLSSFAFSSEVKCYSGVDVFYHKQVKNLFVGEGFIINKDNGYDEVVVADCLIRYKRNITIRK